MPKADEIQAHVIGVWDDGHERIVEIVPGTRGGVATGMKAWFPVVTAYGRRGVDLPSVILRATDRVAVFKTRLQVDEIVYDVKVSAPA